MCNEQGDMSALIITHFIEEETEAHGSSVVWLSVTERGGETGSDSTWLALSVLPSPLFTAILRQSQSFLYPNTSFLLSWTEAQVVGLKGSKHRSKPR